MFKGLKKSIGSSQNTKSEKTAYQFSFIISCGNTAENKLEEYLHATFSSIINQNFNVSGNICFFLLLPENETAVKAGERYSKKYNHCKAVVSADIEQEIYKSLFRSPAQYTVVLNAGDVYSKNTLSEVSRCFKSAQDKADFACISVNSLSKIYKWYNLAVQSKSAVIHLSERKKSFPRTPSSCFIKTEAVRKNCRYTENEAFDMQAHMMNLFIRNSRFATAGSAAVTLRAEEKSVFTTEMFDSGLCKLSAHINRIYNDTGFIPAFVQNYIMAQIMKMLNQSEHIMGNYHQVQYDYSDMWNRLSHVLKAVCDQIIIGYETTRFNKLFLLAVKHKGFCRLKAEENDLAVYYNRNFTYKLSSFPAKIELVNIKNGKLVIEGVCHYPACIDLESIAVKAEINGRLTDIEQVKRYTDRYFYEKVYLYEKGFKMELPLTGNEYSIRLVTASESGNCFIDELEFMLVSSVDKKVAESYCYKDGYAVKVSDSALVCSKCSEAMLEKLENNFRKEIKSAEPRRYNEIIEIRDYYFNHKNNKAKQVWLIMDRPDRADDNGEAFFRYMVQRNEPDIDLYFILSKKSESFNELKAIGKVVEPFSAEHKKLFTIADYMISSQMAEATINPFDKDLKYYRDLFRNPKQIFLQHGVIHNDHGSTLSKYRRDFYGFITSAEAEYNYLLSPKFHYTENEMWLTGMPRFDKLYRDDKKKITIMPTWRKFLTTRVFDENSGTMIWKVNDNFTESEYFEFYNSLINSEKLLNAADKYGYTICFMPHVIFLKETDKFTHNGRAVIYNYEKSYREVYAESSMLVTDYSSAVFDFSYMRRPIVYCQFDFDKFYSEHTVKKGYFNFEEHGFGEVTDNLEDTVNLIIGYMENNCELKPAYKERIDKFFRFSDKKCSERIYNKIREKEKR